MHLLQNNLVLRADCSYFPRCFNMGTIICLHESHY